MQESSLHRADFEQAGLIIFALLQGHDENQKHLAKSSRATRWAVLGLERTSRKLTESRSELGLMVVSNADYTLSFVAFCIMKNAGPSKFASLWPASSRNTRKYREFPRAAADPRPYAESWMRYITGLTKEWYERYPRNASNFQD